MNMSHRSRGTRGLVRSAVRAVVALGAIHAGAVHAQSQSNTAGADGSTKLAAAAAQEDQSGQLQEVVVTGYWSSLEQALQLKQNMAAEADTILAEDIGKFPDQNLAESLQRIPGVAVTREQGEGRQLTVRGLGPQFTRVRINGMEALTTTGGPDNEGGVNRTRAFDFNIFSSDLFNSLTVRKTSEASVDEGSLGATVD